MRDIKDIISTNLINLRKAHNLTQNELADKLSYSDNMVSRWERGEITPNIETLQKISEFYNIPISALIEEGALEKEKKLDKFQDIKKFSIILLMITTLWCIITIAFVLVNSILHQNIWKIFVLGVPLSCVILLLFNGTWNKTLYRFIVISVLIWSLLAYVYLYFLTYNMYFIFLVGVPAELSLVIWAFIKPKKST